MDEINRDTLVMHLSDVRALEIAKVKLIEKLNQNNYKIKMLGYHRIFQKPSYILAIVLPVILTIFFSAVSYFLSETIFFPYLFDRNHNPVYPQYEIYIKISVISIIVIAVVSFLILFLSASSKTVKYNRMVAEDNERVEREKQEIQKLQGEINESISKLKEVNTLLPEIYSINIIPRQYRNVNGICYLYDYMSTSQQSLESAFLNYNVNKINVSVNRIIEQQSEMLLQQYVANTRLEAMERHNKKMLSQLSNIEQNSATAAKYSAITAANAKAITFFEGYNFLKNS